MKKYNAITLIALSIFVISIPLYALQESQRLVTAQAALQQEVISEAAAIYLGNCAGCHGVAGAGLGLTPSLQDPMLVNVGTESLFRTIARAAHGTPMAAWHISEGGILNDYQISALIRLIQESDWEIVQEVATRQQITISTIPATNVEETFMFDEAESNPHRCAACHEEPEIHAGRFGLNCGRCHSAQAWQPALLVRHVFPLNHGEDGAHEQACQTCHVMNYYEHTCYECHEHQPDTMAAAHHERDIVQFDNCIACHPTGAAGEAGQLTAAASNRPAAEDIDQKILYRIEELEPGK